MTAKVGDKLVCTEQYFEHSDGTFDAEGDIITICRNNILYFTRLIGLYYKKI